METMDNAPTTADGISINNLPKSKNSSLRMAYHVDDKPPFKVTYREIINTWRNADDEILLNELSYCFSEKIYALHRAARDMKNYVEKMENELSNIEMEITELEDDT